MAIARAMANDPEILLADEPTGALDSATGRLVMDIFHDLHRRQGKTILLITHSRELARKHSGWLHYPMEKFCRMLCLDRKEGEQNESG